MSKDMMKLRGQEGAVWQVRDNSGSTEMSMDGGTTWLTADEFNNTLDTSNRLVAGGSSLTLSSSSHTGKTVLFDTAAGTALTLPAASGSGANFRCIVSTTVTSNNHTLSCDGTDEFAGVIYQVDSDSSDAVAAYPALAADNFDTITMNGTTKGGLIGDWIEVEDVAEGVWALRGWTNANGTVTSPLSSS